MPAMLTRQEQELLNLLNVGASHDFELTIKFKGGQWHLSLIAPRQTKRGVGETFAESWEDAKPEPNCLHITEVAERARARTGLPSTGDGSSAARPSDERPFPIANVVR